MRITNSLEESIHNLEEALTEEKLEHEKHPRLLGYADGFYNRKDRIDSYTSLLGYLRELQRYRGESK